MLDPEQLHVRLTSCIVRNNDAFHRPTGAGHPDPVRDDACSPPSLKTSRSDIGAHGGPGACNWSPPFGCNDNGAVDSDDIASGASFDCDANGIPEERDIAADPSPDQDAGGILDRCAEI